MFPKIVFIFASLCVVNASVITINVFDDDPETEVTNKQRGCNLRSCEQLCRRLGFTGGACVHGRCKCDNFQDSEDKAFTTSKSLSNPEETVPLRDCNFRACDQLCRRLGFTGGACVNGRCDCDNFLYTEDKVSETAESLPDSSDAVMQRDCNFRACDQLCRNLGFPGGACVNGRCDCDNFLNTEDEVPETAETETVDSLSPSACNYRECVRLCRKRGFPSGSCTGGRCRCHNYRDTEDSCDSQLCNQRCQQLGYTGGVCVHGRCKCNPRTVGDDVTETEESQRGCNFRACDQQCRRLGFTGGACVHGRCKCDNFLNAEDDVTETGESQRGCDFRACDQLCRRLGFTGGACVNGRCKCDLNFLKTEDDVTETEESQRGCNFRACDQQCRRLGFTGGACVHGRCKCDLNFLKAEDDVTETEEVQRGCNFRACDQQCRRLGFTGGACVHGRCKCDLNFLKTEDDVTETGESQRGCDFRACDQLCRRLGFTGGACVQGRCKCDLNFLKAEDDVTETEESQRGCNFRACDQLCRRLGFTGGACVQGRCKCDNFLNAEDPSSMNSTTSNEEEVPDLVLRTSEGELTLSSLRACNTVTCNDMCHRLNYAGGMCRDGVCQCY